MKCENCKTNSATYHSTIIINGNKASTHLCTECAQQAGFISPSRTFGFSDLFDMFETILPYQSYLPDIDTPTVNFTENDNARLQRESKEIENIIDLRMQLQRAIDEERYEDAAVINKKIKALEKEKK